MNSIFPMEIEYFFYKIFDAIDKNFFEKAHAFVWKELILGPRAFVLRVETTSGDGLGPPKLFGMQTCYITVYTSNTTKIKECRAKCIGVPKVPCVRLCDRNQSNFSCKTS